MNIREIPKEELELLSFNDIAYHIIKEDKASKTTINLFKEICKLLNMSDKQYEALVGDFFTSLTTDKRFILLNSVDWDLKENNVVNIVVDESEEDFEESYEEIEETAGNIEKEEDFDLDNDGIDDLGSEDSIDDDDELEDIDELEIVDEESELEE